jgi:hypothetical protein
MRNSCMTRFVDDGWIVITSRWALRKVERTSKETTP